MAKVSPEEKVLTALAGEYYVAAELCRRGYMASLTLKNYPKVDVFALDRDGKKSVPIQVKTTRWLANPKQLGFYLPKDEASYAAAFALVIVAPPKAPAAYETYIVPGKELLSVVNEGYQQYLGTHPGAVQFWRIDLPHLIERKDLYLEQWDRVFEP